MYVFRFKQTDPASDRFTHRDRDLSFYFRPSPSALYFGREPPGRPVWINWDRTTFTDVNGRVSKAAHTTSTWRDRYNSQANVSIQGLQTYSDYLFPMDYLIDPGAQPNTQPHLPIVPEDASAPTYSGRTFSVEFEMLIDDRPRTYSFTFTIASVIPADRTLPHGGRASARQAAHADVRGRAVGGRGLWTAPFAATTADAAMEACAPEWPRDRMEEFENQTQARFLVVYGTRDPRATDALRARATMLARRMFGGDTTRVKADSEATEAMFRRRPGGAARRHEAEPLDREASRAPAAVQFTDAGCRQGTPYEREGDAIALTGEPARAAPPVAALRRERARRDRAPRHVVGEDDWRITRDGEVARLGSFSRKRLRPDVTTPSALDRDREAERALRDRPEVARRARWSCARRRARRGGGRAPIRRGRCSRAWTRWPARRRARR